MQETVSTTKHVKAKVCLVGDIGVGKTSLIKRFVLDTFDDKYIATIGTKVMKRSVPCKWRGADAVMDMVIWDIMGEKGFRQLLKESYFEGTHGIIAVCDLTRRDTVSDLYGWIELGRTNAGEIPMMFLGNKADMKTKVVVQEAELAGLAERHGAAYFLTSAKTGLNVESAFAGLAERVARVVDAPPSP
ncbi:MAG TPA: Rab family GTPase [Thermoplasmata archaeon]|jgi:small GTP-binding protein|nr:Rab family GTPase [Thermoplasmata archaeon]